METTHFKHNNIRLIRTMRKMTAKQLANITGYSQAYISRLESGRRRLNTQVMYKLSIALQCSVHALISLNLGYVVHNVAGAPHTQSKTLPHKVREPLVYD